MLYPVVVLMALPLALLTLVSDPMVQTFIARFSGAYLTEKLGTEIRIDVVRITPLFDLHLGGLLIKDQNKDTLLYTSSLFADIGKRSLINRRVNINLMEIHDASFNLLVHPGDSVLNVDHVLENLDMGEGKVDTTGSYWTFSLSGLNLYNTRFRYYDATQERLLTGMDYTNLDIGVDTLEIKNIIIEKDTFNLAIENLVANDRCGFELNHMSGKFRLSPAFLLAEDLLVRTPNSNLSLDFSFRYPYWNAYVKFLHEVDIEADIAPSVLNLKDIGYFATPLLAMDNELRIGGNFKGKVDKMKVRNLRFAYKDIWFDGDIMLYGLPNVKETFVNLDISNMEFYFKDIQQFRLPGEVDHIEVSPKMSLFGRINVQGSFTGFYNDFVANANFNTDLGEFSTDVNLQPEESGMIRYQGDLKARHFQIGKLLGLNNYLGEMNLEAHVDGEGVTGSSIIVGMNGRVDSLEFMGNNFNQVHIAGILGGNRFNGYVNVIDELGKLDFDGNIDFNKEMPVFDFAVNIEQARLFDLNLLKRDTNAMLSTKMWCSFIGLDLDSLEGRLNLDSTLYVEGDQQVLMKSLALLILQEEIGRRKISIRSDILDADLAGAYHFAEIYPELLFVLDKYISIDNFGLKLPGMNRALQDYTLALVLHKTEELSNVFLPDLRIAPETSFNVSVSTEPGNVKLSAQSDWIIYDGLRFEGWNLDINTGQGPVTVENKVDKFIFKEASEEDDVELSLSNFSLLANAKRDTLSLKLDWNDYAETDKNSGLIAGWIAFVDSATQIGRINEARVLILDSLWTINPDNLIMLDSSSLSLHNLDFIGADQELSIDGKVSESEWDTLSLKFSNWRFSNFDLLVHNDKMDINGEIEGRLNFSAVSGDMHFESNMLIRQLELNEVLFGDANINTSWDPLGKAILVDADVIYQGNVGASKTLALEGAYFPEKSNQNLDLTLSLENFKIKAFKPYVEDVFSRVNGIASGTLRISGSVKKPELTGMLKMMRTELGIGYINTHYSFADEIIFTKNSIDFNDIMIFDSLGNTGLVNGKIKHDHLSEFELDLGIQANNLLCLNTNKYQNEIFYGNAFGSGLVRITGPFNNISLNVSATTNKGTDVYLPLSSSGSIAQHDYIMFIDPDQDSVRLEGQALKAKKTGLSLVLDLDVKNEAEIQIFLPDQMGDINSRGAGKLNMEISPKGDFSIKGDYIISSGNFLFQIQNFIRKRFDILEGGRISFSGSPYNAELRIRGLYKLKTTLTGLSTTLDALYAGERVNVDCIIGLKGKLANPEIEFSVRFPNVEPEARYNIYAVLDTNDQATMNQQMISLLILGSFSYNSGGANLGASSVNLISNQLSNWLSQISRDFDVGINYIPGDDINQDEVEVALSTQLFNDRLVIDGNVGVGGQNTSTQSQNASNIVGDVNIEYKLRPDGRVRLRAFNRSNNIYTFENIAPYTQGIGVFYRKEFDHFGDLFTPGRKKDKSRN